MLCRNQYDVYKFKYNINNKKFKNKDKKKTYSDHRNDDNNGLFPVNIIFWLEQGLVSFDDWLSTRKITWECLYSWNR